jgi:hypothetical protein
MNHIGSGTQGQHNLSCVIFKNNTHLSKLLMQKKKKENKGLKYLLNKYGHMCELCFTLTKRKSHDCCRLYPHVKLKQ